MHFKSVEKFSEYNRLKAALCPERSYSDAEHMQAFLNYIMECLRDELYELVFEVKHGVHERVTEEHTTADGRTWTSSKPVGEPIKTMPEEAIGKLETLLFASAKPEGEDEDCYTWWQKAIGGRWLINDAFTTGFEHFKCEATSGQHCGDCTSVPATCTRCWIDSFYGVDTRSWKNKSEGWKILNRFSALRKEANDDN